MAKIKINKLCDNNKDLLIESSDENPETSLEGIFSDSGFCPTSAGPLEWCQTPAREQSAHAR